MRSARVIFSLLLVIGYLLLVLPKTAFAQTAPTNTVPPVYSTNSYNTPNVDPNVVQNQHTYAQAVTIEVLSAVMCQLTGIDPIDPNNGCLGINPQTKRLGYAQRQQKNNSPEIGGLVGTATDMIAFTYQPVVTTGIYTQYLSDNFGIVKKAYAAAPPCTATNPGIGYGFCGLMPIFNLWVAVRNIAYGLLVFAFMFIGLGIMLRVKIDPRTVMTIQNQIPKVIIAIILITFSYAIAAVLVDLMWVSTYAGVNMIANSSPEVANIDTGGAAPGNTLANKSTRQLLEIPLIYVNNVFHKGGGGITSMGIVHITTSVSSNIGGMLKDIVKNILGLEKKDKCFDGGHIGLDIWNTSLPSVDFRSCIAGVFAWLASIVAILIVFVVLIITLFKIWFNLLKAYIYALMYIIVSPIYIVFGLLPTKPLGFEKWLRAFFANIAIFPLTAFLIVGARVLMELYDAGAVDKNFIPPLIGHNASSNFGSLLAFGALLLAPSLQKILQDKLGAKGIGTPGIVAAGMAAGMSVAGAPVGRAMKHLNRNDQRSGDIGLLARQKQRLGNAALSIPAKLGSVAATRKIARNTELEATGDLHGKDLGKEKGESRKTYRARQRERIKDPIAYAEKQRTAKKATEESGGQQKGTGTATLTAGTVNLNAGNVKGLNSQLGDHLNAQPLHAEHVREQFVKASEGTPFQGKTIDEISALPKTADARAKAESALSKILEDIKKNPPK